ncbi:MAG: CoA transferase [Rhodobacteraceae bacterium]|nr:CoA transferase [Paracoccaceae bacterium]
MKPLTGITVVSLEHAIAAPFCTRQLADLGARVIKVERPGVGDFARGYDERARGLSSHFIWVNRGKESFTLDVKAAPEVLEALVAEADVVVQNLAPGAATRLGLGWEALHARHPKVILADISGYGLDGPYATRKAYDLLIEAEAGFLSLTGTPEAPSKAGIAIADIAAAMYAYSGVLAALIQRGRTGEGSHVDVSMLEALAEWTGHPLYYAMDGAPPPPRTAASHAYILPYGPFEASDGETILLGVQNAREWDSFARVVLERPDMAEDPALNTITERSARRETVLPEIAGILRGLTGDEMQARLERAKIGYAKLRDMADLWAHPQLEARGKWGTTMTSVGAIPALAAPGQRGEDLGDVPALGAHTDAILAEIGWSEADIAALRERSAV